MTTIHEAELLTLAESARLLGVSGATVQRWVKRGRLSALHVGPRAVRIHRSELQAVMPTEGSEKTSPVPVGPAPRGVVVAPLTSEEVQRGIAALNDARQLGAEIRARLGGQPFEESWPLIREARESA